MASKGLDITLNINAQSNADQEVARVNALFNQAVSGYGNAAEAAKKSIAQLRGFSGEYETVLKIRTEADDKGIKRVVASQQQVLKGWDDIDNAVKQANRTQLNSVTSLRQQVNEAKQVRDSIVKVVPAVNAFGQAVTRINPEWDKQNRKVAELTQKLNQAGASGFWQQAKAGLNLQGFIDFGNGVNQIVQIFQSLGIIIGQVTSAANQLINSFKELQTFQMSFEAIGQGAAAGTVAFQQASVIAATLGTDLNATREGFRKLSPVIMNTGGTMTDVSEIMKALSTRFASFGMSAEQSQRVMNGVIQAFSKGKVMSEELTQQISEADAAFKTDLAQALGKSVAALEQMVKAGQVTNQVFAEAIPKMATSSEAFKKLGISATDAATAFAKGDVNINQVINKFKTLETLSFEQLGQSFKPFIDAVLVARGQLIDFFKQFSRTAIVASLGDALGAIVQVAGQVAVNLLKATQAVLVLIKPLIDLFNLATNIPGAISLISTALTVALFGALQKAIGGLGAITNSFKAVANGVSILIESFKATGSVAQATSAALNGIGASTKNTQASTATMVTSLTTLGTSLANINKGVNAYTGSFQKVTQATGAASSSLAQASASFNALLASITTSAAGASQASAAYGTLGALLNAQKAGIASAGQALSGYSTTVVQGASNTLAFGNAIKVATDSALTGVTKIQALKDAIKGITATEAAALGGQLMAAEKGANVASAGMGKFAGAAKMASGALKLLGRALNTTLGQMLKFEIFIRIMGAISGVFDAAREKTLAYEAGLKAAKDKQDAFNKSMEELNQGTGGGAVEETKTKVAELSAEYEKLMTGVKQGSGLWSNLFSTSQPMIGAAAGDIKALREEVGKIPADMKVVNAALAQYNAELGNSNAQNLRVIAAVAQQIAAYDQLIETYKANLRARQEMAMADGEVSPQERAAIGAIQRQLQQLARARDNIANKAIRVGIDRASLEESGSALERLERQMQKVMEQIEKLAQKEIKSIELKLEADLEGIEAQKTALEEIREKAKQIAEEKIRGLEAEKTKAKEASDAIVEGLERQKQASKDATDRQLENIRKSTDAALRGIERTKQSYQRSHDARMRQLDAQAAKVRAALEAELAAIDQAMANESRRHQRRMRELDDEQRRREKALDAPGPAETRLKELDEQDKRKDQEAQIQRLRRQGDIEGARRLEERFRLEEEAAQGAKQREAAKQSLAESYENKRREEEANHQSRMESYEQQRRDAEKEAEEELKQIEEERQAAEEAHSQRMLALDQQASDIRLNASEEEASIREQSKQSEKAIDEEINAAKAAAKEEEKKFDEEIARIKEEERQADMAYREQVKALEEEAAAARKAASEEIRGIEDEIAKLKEDQAKTMGDANSEAETSLDRQIDKYRTMIGQAERLAELAAQRAAGGPVKGGQTYTVNEYGREAFLSSSGRLSMINAPAWGKWTAPGSGVVIPAGLTKALNLPGGGLTLNGAPKINASRIPRGGPSINDLLTFAALAKQSGNSMTARHAENIAVTQAKQAMEIGKLSRAVRDLRDKDWNVNVRVQNNGSNTNYQHTLNTLR